MQTSKNDEAYSHDKITEDNLKRDIAESIKGFAENALKKSSKYVSDKLHYEQINERIRAGDDLTIELPQLREVAAEDLDKIINKLMKKCDENIAQLWKLNAAKVTTTLTVKKQTQEHLARFGAIHKFTTKFGDVTVAVNTKGEFISVNIESDMQKKEEKLQALKSVINQIDLIRLQ